MERFGILFALHYYRLNAFGFNSAPTTAITGLSTLLAISVSKGAENILRYTVTDSTMQLMYYQHSLEGKGPHRWRTQI